jgi:RNA polymerase sigma factor (sigma-70 family)
VTQGGASSKLEPKFWTVSDLGSFYVENRKSLVAHANRILKDKNQAEEVVQDALVKVMLAAPELDSSDHALAYIRRSIDNLCVDIFRIEGRRPNLFSIDENNSVADEFWTNNDDHSDVLASAEDAAIVRQALALLSPAERAALVLWEFEGRSTKEIADELGIKESSVRHTVSRARTSLRKILTTIVIDEDRGLTALDLLNNSYRKASSIAQKSGRAVMSLVLLASAFLGFNSLTGNEWTPTVINDQVVDKGLLQDRNLNLVSPNISVNDINISDVKAVTSSNVSKSNSNEDMELEVLNAQLETAAAMVETLMLLEGVEKK